MKTNNKSGVFAALRMAAQAHYPLTVGTLLCVASSVIASLLPPLLLARIIDGLAAGLPLTIWAVLVYFASLALEGVLSSAQESLLVLDDPFSALDRSTEDTVFANLQEYAKDRVVFLISHRLYHFPQMQRVIFMEDGKTTVGTHEELLAAVPAYRQLYESQTGGQQHENEQ